MGVGQQETGPATEEGDLGGVRDLPCAWLPTRVRGSVTPHFLMRSFSTEAILSFR